MAYGIDLRRRVLKACDSGMKLADVAANLSSHKVKGVAEAIAAAGATLLYLPPYSPDFNPIEQVFSKLKALLRKAAARSVSTLWDTIGLLLNLFPPGECSNYFVNAGYAVRSL